MKNKLLFVFIIFVYFGYTQSISEYYHKINKAELLLTKAKIKNAKLIYDSIFLNYDFVFAKDILVSILIDDKMNIYDSLTLKKIEKLFRRGWTMKKMKRMALWKKLSLNEKNKIKLVYSNNYNKDVNTVLKKKVNKLFEKDQKIRNFFNYQFFRKRVKRIDSTLHQQYIFLTKENGRYIGEKDIGISDIFMYACQSAILALHCDDKSSIKIDSIIDIAIINNDIHNLTYAEIKDRRYYNKYKKLKYGTAINHIRKENIKNINKNRELIFLDTINEHFQKIFKNKSGIHLIYIL